MGSSQSVLNEEDEEGAEEGGDSHIENGRNQENHLVKKLLEQEPEILPYNSSATPLSPQPSSLGTPRVGPSIKVWDPYNVLAPPLPHLPRTFSWDRIEESSRITELFLISNGEWEMSLKPNLIPGRCSDANLTNNGMRQARALAVFLNSQSVKFSAVYSSPLNRVRATALTVCQDLNFAEEHIQSSDLLVDISHGSWEGMMQSEIYTPEILSLMEKFQADFSAPNGESLRQVEYRMIQFLNREFLRLHDRLASTNPNTATHHGTRFTRKRSGKSRLQFVTYGGINDSEDESFALESNDGVSGAMVSSSIGLFTHSVPIKCLVMGLLGCSPSLCEKICIDDCSVSVLQHSWRSGWQIKRLNDTAHLRLL